MVLVNLNRWREIWAAFGADVLMIQTALFIVSMTMFWKYYHAVDIMMARGRETALFSFIKGGEHNGQDS